VLYTVWLQLSCYQAFNIAIPPCHHQYYKLGAPSRPMFHQAGDHMI
jgi:hypothetical protein